MLFANLRNHIDLKAMARQWRRLTGSHILFWRCGFIIRFNANFPVTKSLYQSCRGRQVCRFRVKVLRTGSAWFFTNGRDGLTGWTFAPSFSSGPVFPVSGASRLICPASCRQVLFFPARYQRQSGVSNRGTPFLRIVPFMSACHWLATRRRCRSVYSLPSGFP